MNMITDKFKTLWTEYNYMILAFSVLFFGLLLYGTTL